MRTVGSPALASVYAIAFLGALSFSVVIPVLPERVRDLGGGDAATAAEWMALLASAWGVTQFLFSPFLGALSDRIGRRPVLLLATLGLGFDYLFLAFAPSLPWFLVGRLVGGATAASVPAARAYVADVVPVERRTAAFGKLASTLGAGFIVGPAVGGLLGQIDLRLPFVIAGALCLATFAFGCFFLGESLPRERRRSSTGSRSLAGALAVVRHGRRAPVRSLLAISLLVSLSNMIWSSIWVLFCGHRFGWSPTVMGLQMMAAGLLGVGVQAWLVAPIVERLGETATLRLGLAIGALSMAYAAIAPSGSWFVASMPVAALGLVLAPSLSGLLSRAASDGAQGGVQGAAQSLHGLATIIGPPLYGLVFAWALRESGDVDLSPMAVLLSAGFLVVGLAIAMRAPTFRELSARGEQT